MQNYFNPSEGVQISKLICKNSRCVVSIQLEMPKKRADLIYVMKLMAYVCYKV
jgi:hypothetical protein